MLPKTIGVVLRAMYSSKIRALFFGMEALNLYARNPSESIFTNDADFLFNPKEVSPVVVLRCLKGIHWPEEIAVSYKGHGKVGILYDGRRWRSTCPSAPVTLTISTPDAPYSIDLAFGDPGIPFNDLWRRSKRAAWFGTPLRVASKKDILEMKRMAGREKDKLVLARFADKSVRIREDGFQR